MAIHKAGISPHQMVNLPKPQFQTSQTPELSEVSCCLSHWVYGNWLQQPMLMKVPCPQNCNCWVLLTAKPLCFSSAITMNLDTGPEEVVATFKTDKSHCSKSQTDYLFSGIRLKPYANSSLIILNLSFLRQSDTQGVGRPQAQQVHSGHCFSLDHLEEFHPGLPWWPAVSGSACCCRGHRFNP